MIGIGDLDAKVERLWHRYWDIADGRAAGHARPILWREALRGRTWAMLELSANYARPGRLADRFSAAGLARRALGLGHAWGAQYLARDAFNAGNLAGYRRWMASAARSGDDEARAELRRFETRLPHENAPKGHRRPYRRAERA